MPATTAKLTFFNGIMWQTVLLPDGTRAVWPCRPDGRAVSSGTVRYYRGPGRCRG